MQVAETKINITDACILFEKLNLKNSRVCARFSEEN
jgi:hypothetical protein